MNKRNNNIKEELDCKKLISVPKTPVYAATHESGTWEIRIEFMSRLTFLEFAAFHFSQAEILMKVPTVMETAEKSY